MADILPIDIFRYLAPLLDVKTFVNLTSISKILRKLYFESSIWEKLLARDFRYSSHPTFDVERYKICFSRQNLDIISDEEIAPTSRPSMFGNGLIYADYDEKIVDMLNLSNWDLIHYDARTKTYRPIVHKSTFMVMMLSSAVFTKYIDVDRKNDNDIFKTELLSDPRYSVEYLESDLKDKIIKKSIEVLGCIFSCVKMIEIKQDRHEPANPEIFNKMKLHPRYEEAKLKWRQNGFN